jgi:glycosyltransferase involved in cell wall biosynthesis
MKILLVSHYTLPHIGGIEVLVDQHSQHLAQRGHEVTVLSSRDEGPAEELRGSVRIVRVAAWNFLERWLHVPYPLFAPNLITILYRAIRGADVVHVHGLLYLTSLCSLLWAWWLDKPLILTEHVGFVPYRNGMLNLLQRTALALAARLFLRRADAVVTYNSTVKAWLGELAPYPERLHVVRNGIDVETFRPATAAERRAARVQLGLDPERPLALFVGRFVEKKGVDTVLAAADGTFDLLMCGSGTIPPQAAHPTVHVVRDIPYAEMPVVYRAADVFVLPSRGEGFPVAIMEAMASGLPVVAVRDPAYAEYVTDDEMVQAPPDPGLIRREIARLIADDGVRHRCGQAARERALANFSVSASIACHLEIYEAARGWRQLSTALGPLGHDIATWRKLPVLRELVGTAPLPPFVDVGPGSGYATHHVLPAGPVVVVDISPINLATLRARAHAAGCPRRFLPVRADLAALPFRSGALGTVLCTEVLEHLADDRAAAAELTRVLSPEGRLIVEVPHIARGYASYLERLGVETVHDVPGPEFHHRPGYTIDALRQRFTALGGHITATRSFLGFVGLFVMDFIALIHLLYERKRMGRAAWTWADVEAVTSSTVFTVYRLVFPLLYAITLLDRIAAPSVGFILGVRIEHTRIGEPPSPPAS